MPPLIALPGTLLDERSLAPLCAALAAAAPELAAPRTLLLGDAAQLDDELDRLAEQAGGPAVWVGHSLGGIVALHLALRHKACVAGLVLLAANARAGAAAGASCRAAHWQEAQQHGLRALALAKLGPGYGLDSTDALLQLLADQAEAVGMRRFENQLRYGSTRPGLLEPRRTLAMPLLALAGEADTMCPPLHSAEIATLSPLGQHQTLAGAGHLFPLQQPRWTALQLQRFLQPPMSERPE